MGRSTTRSKAKMVEAPETVGLGDVAVGDNVDLGIGNHLVRFPDGVVVTARSEYVVTDVPGDYAVLNTDGHVTKTFTVADKKAKAKSDPDA